MGTSGAPLELVVSVVAFLLVAIFIVGTIGPKMLEAQQDAVASLETMSCMCESGEEEGVRLEAYGYRRAMVSGGNVLGGTIITICNCGGEDITADEVSVKYEVYLNNKEVSSGVRSMPEKGRHTVLESGKGFTVGWAELSSDNVVVQGRDKGLGRAVLRAYLGGEERSAYSWVFDYLGG